VAELSDPEFRRNMCVECGREQPPGERGWRAYLTDEEDEPAYAVTYCPACAAKEFGEAAD